MWHSLTDSSWTHRALLLQRNLRGFRGHSTKTPTAPSNQSNFVFGRLVQVSKNYRSVIRACMEDMHEAAGKFVCSLTAGKRNSSCNYESKIVVVSYCKYCTTARVGFRNYQDSVSMLEISKLFCKSGQGLIFPIVL